MQLSQLEGFLAIVRHGNLTRAAAELHITQPTLTARIHALEDSVGASLFERTPRGMDLTEAGKAFVVYAERASAALDEGSRFVAALGDGKAGTIVIGVIPSFGIYMLPAVIKRFRETHTDVHIDVKVRPATEILRLTISRDIDLGILREIRHPDIEVQARLFEDDSVLVVAPDHEFGYLPRVTLEDLADETLIVFNRVPTFYDAGDSSLRETGIEPEPRLAIDSLEAAKQLVMAGLGIAILPRLALATELRDGTLLEVPIADATPAARAMVAVRRRGLGRPTGPIVGFLDALIESATVPPGDSWA